MGSARDQAAQERSGSTSQERRRRRRKESKAGREGKETGKSAAKKAAEAAVSGRSSQTAKGEKEKTKGDSSKRKHEKSQKAERIKSSSTRAGGTKVARSKSRSKTDGAKADRAKSDRSKADNGKSAREKKPDRGGSDVAKAISRRSSNGKDAADEPENAKVERAPAKGKPGADKADSGKPSKKDADVAAEKTKQARASSDSEAAETTRNAGREARTTGKAEAGGAISLDVNAASVDAIIDSIDVDVDLAEKAEVGDSALPAAAGARLDGISVGSGSDAGNDADSSCESGSEGTGSSRKAKRRRGSHGGDAGSAKRSSTVRSAGAAGFDSAVSQDLGGASFGPATAAEAGVHASASSSALAVLPEKVRGLLDNPGGLAQEMLALKQSLGVKPATTSQQPPPVPREEPTETVLKMPARLHENLLHRDNVRKLLEKTGLLGASLNEAGHVVVTASTKKGLDKALGVLKRIAYHCQWGCNKDKVTALLADRPARPVTTTVVRLAATSSRLPSHESRLTLQQRKLRIGSQAGMCQCAIEGVPGISRKHCTITLEPDKGAVYVQDLSTNGTYLNGKRLPKPPFKNPQDARVRLFHGDELFFRLRSEGAEELGFVVNLHLLSG
eukprot:TRINITY_DN37345_c0_g1_i1.p1 TRINITY_DN37345_c0_g1~~TRINITY_DN37345_c0_g1_i1.p1  ORF type:complete len:616 (+),score=135.90 TRINITY_DN37345_c0_g1_i1:63-1910(+)